MPAYPGCPGKRPLNVCTRTYVCSLGTTAKQVGMVWACVAKRRQWLGEERYGVWCGGFRARGRPKRSWREVVQKDCQACKLDREDAMDRSRCRKLIRQTWSQGHNMQGQGLDLQGQGQGQGPDLRGQGQGLDLQGQGQGLDLQGQGQGQGLNSRGQGGLSKQILVCHYVKI